MNQLNDQMWKDQLCYLRIKEVTTIFFIYSIFRVFWLKIAKNVVYWCYRYYSKLFGKMRRETEFRQRCCRNSKKKYNELGERENWISVMRLSKFLSCRYRQACSCLKCRLGGALEMETNCGNGIAENGRKKELWQLSCWKWRKRKKCYVHNIFHNKLQVISCYWLKFESKTKINFLPQ